MKNLETLGVQEMDAMEMRNVEGGIIAALIALGIGLIGGYLFGRQLVERGA